jgi:hypothetical protein
MALEAKLLDARNNEIRSSYPDTVTNETVNDARPITATLSTLQGEVIIDLNGASVAVFDLRTAAMSATLVFEGTIDGTNYIGLPGFDVQTEAYLAAVIVTTTLAKTYTVGVSGFRRVRCRVSAFASGTVVVAARASIADLIIYAKPMPSQLHVTATGTSGSAVTATLAAAGAGLFHYITKIHLIQFVVAARTAAATPVLATTTNLPGSPVYSCDATAGAVGQIFLYDLAPAGNPLKSLVANTATTFVGPATTSTIWRWNISYYVGA